MAWKMQVSVYMSIRGCVRGYVVEFASHCPMQIKFSFYCQVQKEPLEKIKLITE